MNEQAQKDEQAQPVQPTRVEVTFYIEAEASYDEICEMTGFVFDCSPNYGARKLGTR